MHQTNKCICTKKTKQNNNQSNDVLIRIQRCTTTTTSIHWTKICHHFENAFHSHNNDINECVLVLLNRPHNNPIYPHHILNQPDRLCIYSISQNYVIIFQLIKFGYHFDQLQQSFQRVSNWPFGSACIVPAQKQRNKHLLITLHYYLLALP